MVMGRFFCICLERPKYFYIATDKAVYLKMNSMSVVSHRGDRVQRVCLCVLKGLETGFSPEPVSRPPVSSPVFRCTVYFGGRRVCPCVELSSLLTCPPRAAGGSGERLYWRFGPHRLPGSSVQSLFSVVDRICAVVCGMPVFVCKNEDQISTQLLNSCLGH